MDIKYNAKQVEEGKYDFWMENGFFESGDNSKIPYTIVIPPPNVTGKLHLGHAWDTTIQDIIIRRKRMQGYDALWLPGMDHAGIATQAKVDEKLRNQGISRYDIGREKFLEVAWSWKEEYAGYIRDQWKALGLSVDYKKERFTLDAGLNKAVNEVFIRLYNKGLIYQGERIINWDCQAQTALSNIEVYHEETKGAFYHLLYKFEDNSGAIEIATTRPETMFADQAIMVHPDDERFKGLVGKNVIIPGTNIVIPVIADSYVDMEFGTGAVKVTPAHDPNDFEVGVRHNLKMPLCMNADGTMNSLAGKYEGLDRFECRKQLVKDLQESGLCVKIQEIQHQVGYSERTHIIVEPRLSKQWFVKMDVLANQALEKHNVEFVPKRFLKTFNHWMETIQDWCISRQLWWGHRIPAWYKNDEVKVQVECPGEGWVQDEDVLDTWFSSALWPFSTLGWPDKTKDYERYYPTDCLVTGYDIIFFWVSRMIFQAIEFTGESPFKKVVIHGLIRDAQGRKMSKSLGNGVDPIDIKNKYGMDTLRYFLNTNVSPGQDLRFEYEKVESAWNYINKIWNIARYIKLNTEGIKFEDIKLENLNESSKWILTKLNKVIEVADYNYEKFEFGEAAKAIYNFVWDDLASSYVELTKVDIANNDNSVKYVLLYVIDKVIKLLHPFIPFVTEEIYQILPHDKKSIMISSWPKADSSLNDFDSLQSIDMILEIIKEVRTVRNEVGIKNSKAIDIIISCENENIKRLVMRNESYLNRFINPKNLKICVNEKTSDLCKTIINTNYTIYIPMSDLINKDEELEKLNLELEKLNNEIARCEKMLSNEGFVKKAPEAKILAERAKLEDYKNKYQATLDHIKEIKSL